MVKSKRHLKRCLFVSYINYYEKIGNKIVNITEEIPFDTPNNWCWVRFPQLVYYYLGKTPDRHNTSYWNNQSIPWFSIFDMKDKEVINQSKERISNKAFKECFNNKITRIGTLLMSFKLTVGRVSILGIDAVHNEAIISIKPYLNTNNIIRDYLKNILSQLLQYCEKTDAIKGLTLNKEKINKILIPISSIKLIDMINKKIDKLFNLIRY